MGNHHARPSLDLKRKNGVLDQGIKVFGQIITAMQGRSNVTANELANRVLQEDPVMLTATSGRLHVRGYLLPYF